MHDVITDARYYFDTVDGLIEIDADGLPSPRFRHLRPQALRVARLIELGAPLPEGGRRETLLECPRRFGPNRRRCGHLLFVSKSYDNILAWCRHCTWTQVITDWQGTRWAKAAPKGEPLTKVGDVAVGHALLETLDRMTEQGLVGPWRVGSRAFRDITALIDEMLAEGRDRHTVSTPGGVEVEIVLDPSLPDDDMTNVSQP